MDFIDYYKDFVLLVDMEERRDLNISETERRFTEGRKVREQICALNMLR